MTFPPLSRRRFLTGFAALAVPPPPVPPSPIAIGAGGFAYVEPPGSPYAGVTLPVYTYRPATVPPDAARVLIVMHGADRSGARCRNQWAALAERYRVLVLAPEFSTRFFPGAVYDRGNVRGADDHTEVPAERWTFPVIERLFAHYKTMTRSLVTGYHLYGEGARASFAHRLIEFLPTARIVRAAVGGADYYTLPDKTGDPYPYSRAQTPDESENARRAVFACALTVLVGAANADTPDVELPRTLEADRQGLTRGARADYFYETARRVTERDHLFLNWDRVSVPGAEREGALLTAAAKVLFTPKNAESAA